MRQSAVTLPPLVEGPARGSLVLLLGAVSWDEQAPGQLRQLGPLQARIKWWGDTSGGEVVVLPTGGSAAAAQALCFQLHTGPKYLTRYLRDMGCLTITIEAATQGSAASTSGSGDAAHGAAPSERQPAAVLATVAVDLLTFDVQAPISSSLPLEAAAGCAVNGVAGGVLIGTLPVSLRMDYQSSRDGALVSSFELNEHLAGAGEQEAASETAEDSCGAAAAGMLGAPHVCADLAAALADRALAAASLQHMSAGQDSEDGDAPVLGQLQADQLCQLLSLLLPGASWKQLDYASAMLLPWQSTELGGGGSGGNGSSTSLTVDDLAAAAAECADVERRLRDQPASEATRCLRQLAAALGSRSLDLTAAFSVEEGQRLPFSELGSLLRRLHPPTTAEQTRCLLAVLAAGSGSAAGSGANPGVLTMPELKAALAAVQEAQQFPTADDLERQQTAVAARRAKEAAAAAAAAIAEQRTAAAAAAALPTPLQQRQDQSNRKQAVVNRLKSSSLQNRRRSSTGGGEEHRQHPQAAADKPAPDKTAAAAKQEQQARQEGQAPCLPTVVMGIPVLPPPAPAGPAGSHPQLVTGTASAPSATLVGTIVPPAAAAAVEPAAAGAQVGPQSLTAAGQQVQRRSELAAGQPAARQEGSPRHDPLLQLIRQAEQLKTALEQASGQGSSSSRTLLSAVDHAASAAPRLPNLLLPPQHSFSPGGMAGSHALAGAAAADGSLPAATATLLAAAKALRHESENMPMPVPRHAASQPATAPAVSTALAAAGPPPASAVAATTAVALPAELGADLSDPESDAEDALLESLFFKRPPQQQQQQHQAEQGGQVGSKPAAAAGAGPAGVALTHSLPAKRAAASAGGQQAAAWVLQVQLQGLEVPGTRQCSSVRCVVKPLGKGGQTRQLTLPVGAAPAAASLVEVPLPQGGAQKAASLPPYLFLEFWQHSGSLVGVMKVPLVQPYWWAAAAASAATSKRAQHPYDEAAVVAEGRQGIINILDLEGRQAGSLYVAAVLQENGAVPAVAAVRHCFSVRIHSAHRLPSAAAYAASGLRAPDGRLLRYSFPGEPDALQTREVSCCSNPSFEASAAHEMVLPVAQSILPLLQDGLLRFELFDCWADQPARQQHGWAALPLSELAVLAAEGEQHASKGAGGEREASKTQLLPLCTEYDMPAEVASGGTAAAAARAPSLKVEISYSAQLCTMDAAEAAAAVAGAAGGCLTGSPAKQCQQASPEGSERVVADRAAVASQSAASAGSDSDEENSRRLANRSSDSRGSSQPRSSSGQPRSSSSQTRHRQRQVGWQDQRAAMLPSAPVNAADAAAVVAEAPPAKPSEPSVPATLTVEVVQACGLAVAVREAAASASASGDPGRGSGSILGRAAAVGPHAFARLALVSEGSAVQAQVPPLQTPCVPQSFCPAWHAAHTYQLQLTGGMLAELASQSMQVEVWHRCPRAAGGSSGSGQREVLLGAGTAPLLDVLRKPQGLRCWVSLAPGTNTSTCTSTCGNVGAVEVAVRLSELAGLIPADSDSNSCSDEALLLRCLPAGALVPQRLRSVLLLPPGNGFRGQLAVVALSLEQLVPPSSGSAANGGRPKANRFFCTYTLPGASSASSRITTAARVLSAVASGGAARSSGGGGGGTITGGTITGSSRSGGARLAAPAGQQWASKLNHSAFFQVTAGPQFIEALLQQPLRVSVYKQPAGAGGSGTAGGARSAVLVGIAELDLSSLLWACSDEEQATRAISGNFPLLEGAAASQGGASLAASVHLQLAPAALAEQQAADAAAAGADAATAVWLLAGEPAQQHQQQRRSPLSACQPEGAQGVSLQQPASRQQRWQEQQEQQQHSPVRQLAALQLHDSSSEDDDEELLHRCRRLTAAKAAAARGQQGAAVGSSICCGVSSSTGSAAGGGSPKVGSRGGLQQGQGQGLEAGDGDMKGQQAACGSSPPPDTGSSSQQQGLAAAGGTDASLQQHLQRQDAKPVQQPEEQPAGAGEEEEGRIVVQVETALHLPQQLASGGSSSNSSPSGGASYCAAVQAVWQQQSHRTAAVPVHAVEAAGLGGTAVWQQELELGPISAAAWAQARSSSGSSSGPTLLLNVWGTAAPVGAEGSARAGSSGGSSRPGSAAAAAPTLLGCTTLDLSLLASQVQQHGWHVLIDSHQQQRGQLKVGVRPNAALLRQLLLLQPPEPAAASAPEEASGTGDLQEQLAVRLQELELLSCRLAGTSVGPAQTQHAQQGAEGVPGGPGWMLEGAQDAAYLRDMPGSDDDDDVAPWDTRQTGYAWSGSGSDEMNDMALLGIAVDGAVSPGFSDVDGEVEAERAPRQPELLLAQDWMFSISKPTAAEEAREQAHAQAAADAAAGAGPDGTDIEQQQQQQQQQRRSVVFKNVLPTAHLGSSSRSVSHAWGGTPAAGQQLGGASDEVSTLSVQQTQQQTQQQQHSVGTFEATPHVPAAPQLHQWVSAPAQQHSVSTFEATPPVPAAPQLQQWVSAPAEPQITLRAPAEPQITLRAGWQFDITRASSPAASFMPEAAAPTAAAVGGQFAPMQQHQPSSAMPPASSGGQLSPMQQQQQQQAEPAGQPADLSTQRQQLGEHSQRARATAGVPAATIDEVLHSLLGSRASDGSMAGSKGPNQAAS